MARAVAADVGEMGRVGGESTLVLVGDSTDRLVSDIAQLWKGQ
jgi:hypothetical protein